MNPESHFDCVSHRVPRQLYEHYKNITEHRMQGEAGLALVKELLARDAKHVVEIRAEWQKVPAQHPMDEFDWQYRIGLWLTQVQTREVIYHTTDYTSMADIPLVACALDEVKRRLWRRLFWWWKRKLPNWFREAFPWHYETESDRIMYQIRQAIREKDRNGQ